MSKTYKVTVSILAVILIIGGIWYYGSKPTVPTETGPIKIGFVGPLTGGPALWGEGARNMMKLAVDEINTAGGINGRMITVDYQDSKCNPKDAVSAVQTLLQNGVKIIVGGHCSPETSGMVPLSKTGQFFMIAGVTSSDDAVSGSDYAFRTSPPTIDFVKQLIKVIKPRFSKIVTLTEAASFSQSYTDDLVKLFTDAGGTVIDNQVYQSETTDFRSILLKIKSEKPDALFISPQNPITGALIAKQMQELDMKIPVFGNSVLTTNSVYKNSGQSKVLVGSFSIIPYSDQTTQTAKEFIQKYKDKFGTDIPYNFFYVSATYDAVNMLRGALQSCSSADTKCIANYFRNVNYKGLSSDYTFKANGDSNFNSWALLTLDDHGQEVIAPITK